MKIFIIIKSNLHFINMNSLMMMMMMNDHVRMMISTHRLYVVSDTLGQNTPIYNKTIPGSKKPVSGIEFFYHFSARL